MKLAYIATYPPRACGIGTFTHNLIRAVFSNEPEQYLPLHAQVLAMTDCDEGYDFPPEVSYCIPQHCQKSYISAATYLNLSDVDVVVLQHEYGIFGGQDGAYVLAFLDELKKPFIATFHTVLKDPGYGQKYVLQRIAAKARKVVVMSNLAKKFLVEIYGLPSDKVAIIEHGVPNIAGSEKGALRRKLGFDGKKVLFTFGLLGRGKGIETVINALPAIVEQHPETKYVVLGKTHPGVLKHGGEEYRDYLLNLAAEKGVAENVEFINAFAGENELWEYLQACDVYITPYLNEAQITSGTLSYAIGAGAAVISTPYWHAQELLAEGRGKLFDFRNYEQLAGIVSELFAHPEELDTMRKLTADYGKHLKWKLVGRQYLNLLQDVSNDFLMEDINGRKESRVYLPPVNFSHLRRLTDDTGILQHAKYCIPNRFEGYCLDDNSRALITVLMARQKYSHRWLDIAASTYISYIFHSQKEDGRFINFMGYDRRFLEEIGSEDSFGRALWSVGYAIANPLNSSFFGLALEIFNRALPNVSSLVSVRSIAFCMLGLYQYLKRFPGDEGKMNLLHELRLRLCESYMANADEEWRWFEDYMTYSNAALPLALYCSLELMPDEKVGQIAAGSTAFLREITLCKGHCRPVGCEKFYFRSGERSIFDQQPLDVMAKVLLFLQEHKITGKESSFRDAVTCFKWFTGKNDLRLPLYDSDTGGCCDGLMADGVNQNQGAESTLAFFISRLSIEAALESRAKHSDLDESYFMEKRKAAHFGRNGSKTLQEVSS